jgi:hypothetical protein
MAEARVMVQVFGTNLELPGCGCGCGPACGPSCGPDGTDDAAGAPNDMEEQTADLGRRLASYYGDGVGVEYVDVFSPRMEEFPLAQRAVFTMNVALPVIAFDGQPRIAGGISIEMVSEELEKRGLTAVVQTAGE